ncbi:MULTISPECIES: NAD(P)H-dependent oxidoreductase [unclassified Paenibacillus]|uniref:NAD(P)H-dependent oxidoreductase n=1 Tax=unclassified Paenibacillus TaxID=185978 RepID=UPI000953B761|nr:MULTISPECIES: NAD(P)H-dependent oxidoreductase [unclassified Paenibacillus]ASS64995.1 NAD(P)H-dependent oxidoreductase [Paenibacillus sp. RUD330]SIQ52063.1 Putative NADPH-quinone reductase (modulator of drug activity B) [Paenibacillus sp. RU4X]SIQ74530.1 Putative NADPH-quinone reductase (modulator of drug activity B) [Paenibacillus sp. RU4T]
MKTLVVVTHPGIDTSVVNRRWMEELRKYPDRYTVHELYKVYPDGVIQVDKEQELIEAHGHLVLQFPIYWFSSPPLLKKWLDEVLTYGWAYGSKGDKLRNRKTALAVTAGGNELDYSEEGKSRYGLDRILSPFDVTFRYCGADYRSFHVFYGAEYDTVDNADYSKRLDESAQGYIEFLDRL